MEKLVVFTGSFCPPTMAHFNLLTNVMTAINAEQGCLLPVADSHIRSKMMKKKERLMLNADIRIKMLEVYCNEHKNVFISDYEIIKNDSDHTYDTFMHLKSENKNKEIYYIMGADKLKSLPKWRNCDGFLANFKFVVLDRADINAKEKIEKNPKLSLYKDNFIILPALDNLASISSTKIRSMFLNKDPEYRKYLHPEVSKILESINIGDYPEIDIYQYIAFKLKNGLSSESQGCAEVYKLNNALFDKHPELMIEENDIHIISDDNESINKEKKFNTNYIYGFTPYSELANKYPNSLIISEASYERTAGGYDQGGHMTLEEELCRITNLSQAIYQFGMNNLKCIKQFKHHKNNIYPLKNNVYINNITFIRHQKENAYRLLDNFNITSNVILVPCLNIRYYSKEKDRLDYDKYCENDRLTKDGLNIMKARLKSALTTALANNHETIIINAFGKEKFKIPYADIVDIFNDVFNEFDGYFKNVIINIKNTGFAKKQFYPYIKLGKSK